MVWVWANAHLAWPISLKPLRATVWYNVHYLVCVTILTPFALHLLLHASPKLETKDKGKRTILNTIWANAKLAWSISPKPLKTTVGVEEEFSSTPAQLSPLCMFHEDILVAILSYVADVPFEMSESREWCCYAVCYPNFISGHV